MVRDTQKPKLSIILPTLNEAGNLPLLLADISLLLDEIELIIVDGGSKDLTKFIGKLSGAKIFSTNKANRGKQLNIGALEAKGEWLLFLHADCKISEKCSNHIREFIKIEKYKNFAWFFNFRVNRKGINFRLLEIAVFMRSNLLKMPYGDQGLLISKDLYIGSGGYKDLYVMEDIEFVLRLSKLKKLKNIGEGLITDARRWDKHKVLKNAINNCKLLYLWRKGENTKLLYSKYYSE